MDIFYFGKINSPKTRILVQQILELASCTFFGEIKCIHFVFLRIFLGFLICLFFTNKLRQLLIPHTGLVAEEWNQEESKTETVSVSMYTTNQEWRIIDTETDGMLMISFLGLNFFCFILVKLRTFFYYSYSKNKGTKLET